MDISGIMDHTNITQIETMISDYNENIGYYNRNMRELLEMYRISLNDEMLRRRLRQRRFYGSNHNTNSNSNSFFYNSINDVLNPRNRNLFTTQLQDDVVCPTNEQIENAVENIVYDSSFSQFQCPISLEQFEEGIEICRIKHCRHLFKRSSLMDWFQRNVRCPVCRYDIRDYIEEDSEVVEQTRTTTIYPYTNSRSLTQTTITNFLRNFLTSEINETLPIINELTFSFDLPTDYDVSYNSV